MAVRTCSYRKNPAHRNQIDQSMGKDCRANDILARIWDSNFLSNELAITFFMENLGNLYVSFYKLNIHIICIVMKSYKVIWLLAIIAFYWLILPILCCIWESYLNNGYLLLIGIVSGYSKAIYSIVLYSTYIVYLHFFFGAVCEWRHNSDLTGSSRWIPFGLCFAFGLRTKLKPTEAGAYQCGVETTLCSIPLYSRTYIYVCI